MLLVTYAGKKSLLGKICECRSNPKELSTTEVGNHKACCYSFLSAEKKVWLIQKWKISENCFVDLRDQVMKVFENEKMKKTPLTDKKDESHSNKQTATNLKKELDGVYERYCKIRGH